MRHPVFNGGFPNKYELKFTHVCSCQKRLLQNGRQSLCLCNALYVVVTHMKTAFENILLFRHIRCMIARINCEQCSSVRNSTSKRPNTSMLVKNCCVVTKYTGHSAWTRVTKWKTIIMDRDGLHIS